MTQEVQSVQAALETSKKALFFLNQALATLNTAKPVDLLQHVPYAKPIDPDETIDSIETVKFIYICITNCIEHASHIRNELLRLELYDIPYRIPRATPSSPPSPPTPPASSPAASFRSSPTSHVPPSRPSPVPLSPSPIPPSFSQSPPIIPMSAHKSPSVYPQEHYETFPTPVAPPSYPELPNGQEAIEDEVRYESIREDLPRSVEEDI